MGPEQLSAVMEVVGRKVDLELKARIERESEFTFSSTGHGTMTSSFPRTRRVLGVGLGIACGGRVEEKKPRWGVRV